MVAGEPAVAAARAIKLRHFSLCQVRQTLDFVCDPRGPVKTRRLCRGGPSNKTRRSRGQGGTRMNQQPPMSSFSALEFHAGYHKGTASLAVEAAAVAERPYCHFGEPLYNARRTRFVLPMSFRKNCFSTLFYSRMKIMSAVIFA